MDDEEAMEKEAKSSKLKKKVPFTWCESTRELKREGRREMKNTKIKLS